MGTTCCRAVATLLAALLSLWTRQAEALTPPQALSCSHSWCNQFSRHPQRFEQTTSFYESRFEPGRKQLREWSCGPAALANLLSVFFGCPTDENAIIEKGAAARGDTVGAEAPPQSGRGSSLAALLESARSLGFDAAVYLMDAALLQLALAEIRVPVIGLLRESAGHFVIAVGQVRGDTLVFDPALGFRLLPEKQLLDRWSGFTLVVDPGTERIDACGATVASLIHGFEQRRRFLDELTWIVH